MIFPGVEWGWSPAAADAGEDPRSQGWWPSLDLETTRRLTKGSRPHERAWHSWAAGPAHAVVARASSRRGHGISTAIVRPDRGSHARRQPGGAGCRQGPGRAVRRRAGRRDEGQAEPMFASFACRLAGGAGRFSSGPPTGWPGKRPGRTSAGARTGDRSVGARAAGGRSPGASGLARPLRWRRCARQGAFLGRTSPMLAMPHVSGAGGQGGTRFDRDRQERPRRHLSQHRRAQCVDRA